MSTDHKQELPGPVHEQGKSAAVHDQASDHEHEHGQELIGTPALAKMSTDHEQELPDPVHEQGKPVPVHDQAPGQEPDHEQELPGPVHEQEKAVPVHDQGPRSRTRTRTGTDEYPPP